MSEQALDNRAQIAHIKKALDSGTITYTTAQALAEPVIKRINEANKIKTAELNKKYGTHNRAIKFEFAGLMRNDY